MAQGQGQPPGRGHSEGAAVHRSGWRGVARDTLEVLRSEPNGSRRRPGSFS